MCALIKFNGAVSPLYNQNIYVAAYVLYDANAETTMRVYANVTKAQAQNEMLRMEGKMKLK